MPRPQERVLVAVALAVLLVASAHLSAQSDASRKALESAAAKGSLAAQYALGSIAESDGDLERALALYTAAAEAGYPGAQFKLAELLQSGRGVPRDVDKAKEWYRKAADQGLAQAVNKLNELGDTPTTVEPTKLDERQQLVPGATTETQNEERKEAALPVPTPTQEQATTAPPASNPMAPLPGAAEPEASSIRFLLLIIVPLLVAGPVGLFAWRTIRAWVLDWYRSRQFFISSRSAGEMMAKEVGLRLQVEWIPVVLAFIVSFAAYFVATLVTVGVLGSLNIR